MKNICYWVCACSDTAVGDARDEDEVEVEDEDEDEDEDEVEEIPNWLWSAYRRRFA